jgi:hypothetical protein
MKMEKDFFIVVGTYEKDGETKEWEQSIHTDYDKAYTQYMANGMSTGGMKWRIDRYYGRKVSTMNE